jgi:hypothetical protein
VNQPTVLLVVVTALRSRSRCRAERSRPIFAALLAVGFPDDRIGPRHCHPDARVNEAILPWSSPAFAVNYLPRDVTSSSVHLAVASFRDRRPPSRGSG